jgi:hypothetical protein
MSGQGRRLLVLVYASSFLVFSAYPTFLVRTQTRVLSDGMTDHISHWGSTILLGLYGTEIYRVPTEQLCLPAPAPHVDFVNCLPYKHPGIRPFFINWTQYPRVYPPGFALLGIIPALLHVFTPLSFGHVNLVMMLEILFVAHLASMALFVSVWRAAEASQQRESFGLVLFVVMPLLHLQLVNTALMGIYDPLAILAVVVSILNLSERKPVHALVAMSLALFFHFRALWQLPVLAIIFVELYRSRAEWWRSRRARTFVSLSAVLLLISGACFLAVSPALQSFKLDNPLHWVHQELSAGHFIREWLLAFSLMGALAYQRHWTTLALVAWQLVMLVQTRQIQIWHPAFLLPIFAMAATEKKAAAQAISTTFVFFVWESWRVYNWWAMTNRNLAVFLGL